MQSKSVLVYSPTTAASSGPVQRMVCIDGELLRENQQLRKDNQQLRNELEQRVSNLENIIYAPTPIEDLPYEQAKVKIFRHIQENPKGIHMSDVAIELGVDIEIVYKAIQELEKEGKIDVRGSTGN